MPPCRRRYLLRGEPAREPVPDGRELGGGATSLVTVDGDLPSSAAISRALRLRSSILSTVFLSCLVSLPYDLPDGFGLDISASLHRGSGDSGPSGVAYPDSRLRTQRNALR